MTALPDLLPSFASEGPLALRVGSKIPFHSSVKDRGTRAGSLQRHWIRFSEIACAAARPPSVASMEEKTKEGFKDMFVRMY